jgi:hypothetical protein
MSTFSVPRFALLLLGSFGLGACSLINAYDEVLPGSGGSGGSGGGGGGSTTSSSGGGGSGATGGGGGGGEGGGSVFVPPPLGCTLQGRQMIFDTSPLDATEPRNFSTIEVVPLPNGRTRVYTVRRTDDGVLWVVQPFEINGNTVTPGQTWTVGQVLDIGRLGPQHMGALVTNTAGLKLLVFDHTQGIGAEPTETQLETGLLQIALGRFVHLGPDPDEIAYVTARKPNATSDYDIDFRRFTGATPPNLFRVATGLGGGALNLRGLVIEGSAPNRVAHVFSGSADGGGVGTQRYTFDAESTPGVVLPAPFGSLSGVVVGGAARDGNEATISAIRIRLENSEFIGDFYVGAIDTSEPGEPTLADMRLVHTFTGSDFPSTDDGTIHFPGGVAIAGGTGQNRQRFSLMLTRTSTVPEGNVVRYYGKDILTASSQHSFVSVAGLGTTGDIAEGDGGLELAYVEEREDTPGMQVLYVHRLACTSQTD